MGAGKPWLDKDVQKPCLNSLPYHTQQVCEKSDTEEIVFPTGREVFPQPMWAFFVTSRAVSLFMEQRKLLPNKRLLFRGCPLAEHSPCAVDNLTGQC
jgi:hypothetical protein